MAYGQTGSGKTYTMGTTGALSDENDYGIIPRFIHDVFERKRKVEEEHPGSEIVLRVSYLELYGETVRDLLDPTSGESKEIIIRSDELGNVQIIGEELKQVVNESELFDLLEKGSLCRSVGRTNMNAFSSRSHAVFTVYIDQEIPVEEEDENMEEKNSIHEEDVDMDNNHNNEMMGMCLDWTAYS